MKRSPRPVESGSTRSCRDEVSPPKQAQMGGAGLYCCSRCIRQCSNADPDSRIRASTLMLAVALTILGVYRRKCISTYGG